MIEADMYTMVTEADMRPSEASEQTRESIREIVPQFRTANPRVFASVLHGLDRENSDPDIIVDTLPGTTLFDLVLFRNNCERFSASG